MEKRYHLTATPVTGRTAALSAMAIIEKLMKPIITECNKPQQWHCTEQLVSALTDYLMIGLHRYVLRCVIRTLIRPLCSHTQPW